MGHSHVGKRHRSSPSSYRVFNHVPKGKEIGEQFLYALEFCNMATGSGWNELALKEAFY